MKVILVLCLVNLVTGMCFAQNILFEQNFDAGSPVSQYINASSPGTTKFNGINGPSGSDTIVNGTLQFSRLVNGTTGHFSRSTNWSPAPTSLYIQFDFEVVSTTTTAGSSALIFAVGSSLGNGVSLTNANIYARFGIGFTGGNRTFTVRPIPVGGGGSNSPAYTGRQTLTFILNNTGFTVTYLQPGGGTKRLLNDLYDLWVGNNRVLENLPVLMPGQTMTNFKLRIDDDVYAAIFQFDNFLIRDIGGALPVAVLDFKAVAAGSQVGLSWQLASETPTVFTVERSPNALDFAPVAQLQTDAASNGQRTYNVTDTSPAPGPNYYRLRQTGTDGQVVLSKIVTVDMPDNVPDFTILNNPSQGLTVSLRTTNLPGATYLLATLTGQTIDYQARKTPDGRVTLLLQHPLPSGVYLLTAQTEATSITRRLLVR